MIDNNADTTTAVKETAIRELQDGARGAQTITQRANMEHRKDAVINGNDETKFDTREIEAVLNEMVADGLLERISDPEGWYQLADWDDRPLRVLSVSHHQVKIGGVGQIESLWLDESIRAARYEHGIDDPSLQSIKDEDDRCCYLICTRDLDILDQYRETLTRLADETRGGSTDQSRVYSRLVEATDIEDQYDRREREVPLRE